MVRRGVMWIALAAGGGGCLQSSDCVRDDAGWIPPDVCTWTVGESYALSDSTIDDRQPVRVAIHPTDGDGPARWILYTLHDGGGEQAPVVARYAVQGDAPGPTELDGCHPTRGVILCPDDDHGVIVSYSDMRRTPPVLRVAPGTLDEPIEPPSSGAMSGLSMLGGRNGEAEAAVYVAEEGGGVHTWQIGQASAQPITVVLTQSLHLQDTVASMRGSTVCTAGLEAAFGDYALRTYFGRVSDSDWQRSIGVASFDGCGVAEIFDPGDAWLLLCPHLEDETMSAFVSDDCQRWTSVGDGRSALAAPLPSATDPHPWPAITMGPLGDAVAVWRTRDAISVVQFGSDGEPLHHHPIPIAAALNAQPRGASVACDDDGCLVAWSADESGAVELRELNCRVE